MITMKQKIMAWLTDKRRVTYMAIPHNGGTCKQMAIPVWGVRLMAITLVVLTVTAWALYANYRLLSNKYDATVIEVETLRVINVEQATQIEKINATTTDIHKKLDKLSETDKKVQQLINQ